MNKFIKLFLLLTMCLNLFSAEIERKKDAEKISLHNKPSDKSQEIEEWILTDFPSLASRYANCTEIVRNAYDIRTILIEIKRNATKNMKAKINAVAKALDNIIDYFIILYDLHGKILLHFTTKVSESAKNFDGCFKIYCDCEEQMIAEVHEQFKILNKLDAVFPADMESIKKFFSDFHDNVIKLKEQNNFKLEEEDFKLLREIYSTKNELSKLNFNYIYE